MRKHSLLLIGGTGFIGEHLLRALSAEELQSTLVFHASPIKNAQVLPPAWYQQTNLKEEDPLRFECVKDVERVIILTQPNEAVISTILKLFDAAPHLRHILYVSSLLVYPDNPAKQTEETAPDPQSPYEVGKLREELLFETYAAKRNILLCIARLSNVYGDVKSKGIINKMFHALEKKTPIQIRGDGTQKRDYIFVDDIALALAHLLRRDQRHPKEIFNICTGHGSSLNEVMLAIEEITGQKLQHTYEESTGDKQCIIGDNGKIRATLPSFDPIVLHDGLQKAYARFYEMGTG